MTLTPVSIPGHNIYRTLLEMGRRTELSRWRKEQGWDQETLSRKLGVSRSAVAAYESGQTRSVPANVVTILRGLGFAGSLSQNDEFIGEIEVMVPFIGQIKGARPDSSPLDVAAQYRVPSHMTVEECFAGEVVDDAMMPSLKPGAIVIVKPTPEIRLSNIVLWSGPEGMMLRRFEHDGRDYILTAENPKYPPVVAEGHALGVVLGFLLQQGDDIETRYKRSGLR
jgi:SOS-response transcriptional repressor LexA